MLQEAQTLARLSHPHVVQIYEVGEDDSAAGHPVFIAMEYVAGQSLRSFQENHPLHDKHAFDTPPASVPPPPPDYRPPTCRGWCIGEESPTTHRRAMGLTIQARNGHGTPSIRRLRSPAAFSPDSPRTTSPHLASPPQRLYASQDRQACAQSRLSARRPLRATCTSATCAP